MYRRVKDIEWKYDVKTTRYKKGVEYSRAGKDLLAPTKEFVLHSSKIDAMKGKVEITGMLRDNPAAGDLGWKKINEVLSFVKKDGRWVLVDISEGKLQETKKEGRFRMTLNRGLKLLEEIMTEKLKKPRQEKVPAS